MKRALFIVDRVFLAAGLFFGLLWVAVTFETSHPNALVMWLHSQSITAALLQGAWLACFVLSTIISWTQPQPQGGDHKPNLWDRRPGLAQLIMGVVIGGFMLVIWVTKYM